MAKDSPNRTVEMKPGITRRQFIKTASAVTAALAINGPSLSGLASKTGPKKDLPIVVIDTEADPVCARAVLDAGCAAYVVAATAPDDLLLAAREAMQGRTFVPSSISSTAQFTSGRKT